MLLVLHAKTKQVNLRLIPIHQGFSRYITGIFRRLFVKAMNAKLLATAVGILLLFALPVMVIRPVAAAPSSGLVGAFWYSSYFGSALPAPSYPGGCVSESSNPAGSDTYASTGPTATEIDPNIAHGTSTGFEWMENSPGFTVGSTQFYNVEFSVEWTGYIALSAGTTYFQLESDDGSWLYINPTAASSTITGANIVVNNGNTNPTGYGVGIQPPTTSSGSVTVASAGSYPIEVDYYETCDSQSGIDLSWTTSPTGAFSIVPSTAFTPACIASNANNNSAVCESFLPPTGVPEFGAAAPMVAVMGLLAVVLMRRASLGRIGTTA